MIACHHRMNNLLPYLLSPAWPGPDEPALATPGKTG
jgi:hypothetical protein